MYGNTPRVRCTIHTHTQHTHNSFYTVIMLQRDLMLVFNFFFFLNQHHIIRNNNHKWVKNCRRQIPSKNKNKKKKRNSTKWVAILNAIKHTLYSWSHTKNSWQTSDTFWAIASLWDAGRSISISIPWVCESLYSEDAFSSLDYKPHFSKHGVNRIPWRVWWAGQECTELEWIQREILAGNRPGSHTQTWLFPIYSIRFCILV